MEKIGKVIQKGLASLHSRDLYDHNEQPMPNELGFKMLVIGTLTALGWACKSEVRVAKESGGHGFVDIVAQKDGERWFIELKYYSLAYWSTKAATYPSANLDAHAKQRVMEERYTVWRALSDKERLSQLFIQKGVSEDDLKLLEERQYKRFANSTAVTLDVLITWAGQQVYNYASDDVQRCVIAGAGPTCIVASVPL